MLGQRIISGLIAWLKAAITGQVLYMLMLLLMRDTMHIHRIDEMVLFSMLNFMIYVIASMVYIFIIIIPVGLIDKKAFDTLSETDFVCRYLPFTMLVFVGIAAIIFSMFSRERNMYGELIIVCTTFYNALFGSLLFFIYTDRKRMRK